MIVDQELARRMMRISAQQLNAHAKAKREMLQAACDEFNAKFSVGDKVFYSWDDGEKSVFKTATKAYVMAGYDAVVQLQGLASCHLLDRISPIEDTNSAAPKASREGA